MVAICSPIQTRRAGALGIVSAGLLLAALGSTAMAAAPPTAPWEHFTPAEARQADAHFVDYRFADGEALADLKLHYATLGTPHRDGAGRVDNAVLVLHWTGASGATLLSPTYMKALFGSGRPLDSQRYYLIFPDNVGHGQSSKPSDGLHARFPRYGYTDLVDLQHRLVADTLGISHLHAILGMSMGGMNAWQWAERYPDMMDGVMPVVSLPIKVSGRNLLWRRMVSEQIRQDPQWRGGDYTSPPQGWLHAYEMLRLMIDGAPHLQASIEDKTEADLDIAATQNQARTTDANDVLYSIEASLDYDPEPGLGLIRTHLFALNFADDAFNPDEVGVLERLAPTVKSARYKVRPGAPTTFGHLTMAHPELWADEVKAFMQDIEKPKLRPAL